MKEYRTKDGYKIKSIGRDKQIYFNNDGSCFFVWNGRRYRLDEVMRLTYPVFYEDNDGKLGFCSGYITISNCIGVLVELTCDDQCIQLWQEVERG